jgi:hypothetical protein
MEYCNFIYCHVIKEDRRQTGVGLVIVFIELFKQLVSANNYDSSTELHTPKITVTAAHIKSSPSSLDDA